MSGVQQLRRLPQRNTLILDWDGTLTPNSTLSLIAGIRPDAPSLAPFTEAYEADLAKHAAQWPNIRRTYGEEKAQCTSLAVVELASIRRLETAEIWQGVTGPPIQIEDGSIRSATERHEVADVEKHAQGAVTSGKVQLRPGAFTLIQRSIRRREPVVVISVSWSGSWIAACLTALGIPAMSAATPRIGPPPEDTVMVVANEIDPAGSGRLSRGCGYIGGTSITFDGTGESGLWTAADKLDAAQTWSLSLGKGTRMVCLGDSLGDLLMLQSAEVAIIVVDEERKTEQRLLEERLQVMGLEVEDVQDYKKGKETEGLWRVTGDLKPVLEFIAGSNG